MGKFRRDSYLQFQSKQDYYREAEDSQERERDIYSVTNNELYYRLGIIDFLQKYNKKKRLETQYLKCLHKEQRVEAFSSVDPATYAQRFYQFMNDNLFVPESCWPAFNFFDYS